MCRFKLVDFDTAPTIFSILVPSDDEALGGAMARSARDSDRRETIAALEKYEQLFTPGLYWRYESILDRGSNQCRGAIILPDSGTDELFGLLDSAR